MNEYYTLAWSKASLVLYIIMGIICWLFCHYAKRKERKTGIVRKTTSVEYWTWIITWSILAVFRYIDSSIGGTDAPSYINYFENCLDMADDTTDFAFMWLNRIIRYFTDDYHVFFFIFYLFVIFSFIVFINEFSRCESSSIPLCILFYLYLRSFTSIRSNLAISFLLIALVALHRKKYFWTILLAILSIFSHVSAVAYVAFILFFYLYKERKMGLGKSIAIFSLAFAAAVVAQTILKTGAFDFLRNIGSGAYLSYAQRFDPAEFFTNYSVSNLPQLALFIVMIIYRKQIDKVVENASEKDKTRIQFVRLMCYYDFFIVPIITLLSIYRGYEYFYIARLVMWGEIIQIVKKYFNQQSRRIVSFGFMVFFIVWMYGRIEATWESSHLMPYVFGLFK